MPLFVYPQKVRNFHMYKAFQINVPVNSSCTHLLPPPPGYCGPFARLSSPRGGAFAHFALPGYRAFANPGAIPELLSRTRFPIKISLHRGLLKKKEGHRAVTACSRFYTCISSLLIKIELHRERHPFMFIKLFITCNFTAPIILISISFNVNNFISILKP